MGVRIKAEHQKLLSRLKEIGQTLSALSAQNTAAVKAGDWELARRVQNESAELTELQASLMRQLRQIQI